jgi:hypothetical protein
MLGCAHGREVVLAMSEKLPGLARNSCPLCGELASVPWWRVLPSKRRHAFKCSSCYGRLTIADSTRVAAVAGMVVGALGAGCLLMGLLVGAQSGICAPAILGAAVAGGALMGRLTLSLEPAPPEG